MERIISLVHDASATSLVRHRGVEPRVLRLMVIDRRIELRDSFIYQV